MNLIKMNRATLTICILSKSEIKSTCVASYMDACADPRLLQSYAVLQQLVIGQSDIAKARSLTLTQWYENSKNTEDLFLFVDSDQTFKVEDIFRAITLTKNADVVCGGYSRTDGSVTLEPVEEKEFIKNREGAISYSGCGFMLITKPLVEKVAKHLNTTLRSDVKELTTIPFFYPRIVRKKEEDKEDTWLGEDYSFCWLVRHVEGKLVGFVSETIGHILSEEKYIDMENVYFSKD